MSFSTASISLLKTVSNAINIIVMLSKSIYSKYYSECREHIENTVKREQVRVKSEFTYAAAIQANVNNLFNGIDNRLALGEL